MLGEALLALGFFALAVPFGYLSRRVKGSKLDPMRKWPLFLGVVHTPVFPLVALAKLDAVTFEVEIVLAAVILLGHTTGILIHRQRNAVRSKAPLHAPAQE